MKAGELSSIHDYSVFESEWSYNIKWTILSHCAYIISKEVSIRDLFSGVLARDIDEVEFRDYLPENMPENPIFACEFLGHRSFVPSEVDRLYAIQYRGAIHDFFSSSEYGERNMIRAIEFLHDTIISNIREATTKNRFPIFDFTKKGQPPTQTAYSIALSIEESVFDYDPNTLERLNGIDWVYRVITL